MTRNTRLIKLFFIALPVFVFHASRAQPFTKAANNAFIITRMAEKFHIEPRTLNDSLSNDFFNLFLKQLDEDGIYFNKEDIQQLAAYRYQLDDLVKQKQLIFLALAN